MIVKNYVGVPLGGLGTGKVSFYPDLTIGDLTIMNNWMNPLNPVRGFHIVLLTDQGPVFMQANPGRWVEDKPNYRTVGEVVMDAEFPKVRYVLRNPDAIFEFYAPLIPGDLKNSSIPAIVLRIRGNGLFALSFPNLTGSRRWGRVNVSIRGKVNGVLMRNVKAPQTDPAYGEIFIGCVGCSTYAGYSLYIPGEKGMTEDISIFSKLTDIEDPGTYAIRPYAREEVAGVVWKEVRGEDYFVISWFFNGRPYNYPYGHYYENWFSSALDVAEYVLSNPSGLEPRLNIEAKGWLRDALYNSLYVLASTSWFTRDGRLAFYESTAVAPLMNTIGSFTWDGLSYALLQLYPDIVLKMDEYMAQFVRDGEAPHDLGEESIDEPIYGASYKYPWNDLGPTLILMLYRDYYYTGDKAFLSRAYKYMRDIVEWLIRNDEDGDCVPDSRGGFDNSYDGTKMYGASSYTASLFACSLQAFIRASQVLGIDVDSRYVECLRRAKETLNSMWNGKYFIAWRGHESCMNSQILGQLWCDLLDLPPIVDDDKVKGALRSIYELNHRASKYCLANSANPDGTVDTYSGQTRSCWPRVSFAVAAHMVLRGMVKEGLEIAEKEWSTIVGLNPFNQSSRIDAIEGRYVGLMEYIGSASVWLLYIALKKANRH